jgi:decaprenyl-phosphate phosphoribosyltransferase
VLTAAYSLGLKSIAIIDIATVSAGFVLRALAGGFATGVPNSKWFLLLVSLGALFVVSGKRYAEVIRNGESIAPGSSRATYTAPYLRFVWIAAATLTIAAYCLWTFSAHPNAVGTLVDLSAVPFVLAILRYALLVDAGAAGKPEDLFISDHTLRIVIVRWLLIHGGGVYFAAH